jgi:hypothetical protein
MKKDTLLYLLKQLVEHTDDVTVEETGNDPTHSILTIHAHADDMGKIIGKQGRIIRALRDLIKIMATKENTYVDVVLAE